MYWRKYFQYLRTVPSYFSVLCFLSQFYRCFLILFHCKHRLSENSHSSMPSNKTIVLQLNKRVGESNPIVTGHISGPPHSKPCTLDKDCTSPNMSDKMDPPPLPNISSWVWRAVRLLAPASTKNCSWWFFGAGRLPRTDQAGVYVGLIVGVTLKSECSDCVRCHPTRLAVY